MKMTKEDREICDIADMLDHLSDACMKGELNHEKVKNALSCTEFNFASTFDNIMLYKMEKAR